MSKLPWILLAIALVFIVVDKVQHAGDKQDFKAQEKALTFSRDSAIKVAAASEVEAAYHMARYDSLQDVIDGRPPQSVTEVVNGYLKAYRTAALDLVQDSLMQEP